MRILLGIRQQKLSDTNCVLWLIALLLAFLWAAGAAYIPAQAGKDTPEDTPVSPSIQDRLAPPPMGNPPNQVDKGHFVYYLVCMACHGDHGQGLTDEWRAQFGPQDMNCWQSKCHSFNHPPQGFQLVKTVPALIGPGTLSRFDNAQQLHDYIIKTMPWWKPGYLRADEFWQVAAFLMSEHGVLPKKAVLDEGIAAVYLLRPASPLPGDYRAAALMLALVLVLTIAVIIIQQKLTH